MQYAISPVLDAHENQRAEHVRGSDAVASGAGVLQAALQILAHLLKEGEVLIEELGDGSQEGVELDHRRVPRSTPHRSEEHTSELQSQSNLVCRLLLEKKKKINNTTVDYV